MNLPPIRLVTTLLIDFDLSELSYVLLSLSVASTRSGGSSARLGRKSPGTSRKPSRRALKMYAAVRWALDEQRGQDKYQHPLRAPARAKVKMDSVPDKPAASRLHPAYSSPKLYVG